MRRRRKSPSSTVTSLLTHTFQHTHNHAPYMFSPFFSPCLPLFLFPRLFLFGSPNSPPTPPNSLPPGCITSSSLSPPSLLFLFSAFLPIIILQEAKVLFRPPFYVPSSLPLLFYFLFLLLLPTSYLPHTCKI